METVHLPLGDNSYDIYVGSGLLGKPELLTEKIAGAQVFIVSNETVADHYLDAVKASLGNFKVDTCLIPDGEQYKTLDTLDLIVGELLARGHNRSTTIIALGGGVVGDTAGFTAASFQRGVAFIQIPTTLLSQVDSSVGGKTAVNHAAGKNMIGAFYQPKAVYIDTDTLKTLPARELSAGLAEVIKHGLLADKDYFDYVETHIDELLSLDAGMLTETIKGSCEIKARVVAADEKESGVRALLNLGHTFAHAIETGTGYGEWLHGEAVGAGLVMAADLSMRLGRCSPDDALRIKRLTEKARLPVAPPESLTDSDLLELMARDKKATDEGMRFVLLKDGPGQVELVSDVPLEKVKETLTAGEALCES